MIRGDRFRECRNISSLWYVATTEPRGELTAEAHVRKLRGIQPFNPRYRVTKIQRGRKVIFERQYISGYLFLNFDVDEVPWRYINTQPGIQRLLSTGPECPTRIRLDVMAVLLGRCNRDGIVDADEVDEALARFVPIGSLVKISDGLFAGYSGRVKLSERDRLEVVLSVFKRPTPVPVRPEDVEMVSIA